MQSKSVDRWVERLTKAAVFLGSRLDDPPSLEELAVTVGTSPFHLHRVWRALTGETVAESLARLRIEASKEILKSTGATVTRAAMEVGFSTPQSFARAFRRQTGVSPSQFQAGRQANAVVNVDATVTLILRTATHVVALRREGEAYRELNATFAVLFAWAEKAQLLDRLNGIYGIAYDDPSSVPMASLRYDVCVDLGHVTPPSPFVSLALPTGDHARLRVPGPYDGLEAALQYLVGDWLPSSGREPADFPAYYEFLNDPDYTEASDLLTDLWLPLKPREE